MSLSTTHSQSLNAADSAAISREALVSVIHFLDSKGWTPATSSNFSCRENASDASRFWISVSGLEKGVMTASDFLEVDNAGQITRFFHDGELLAHTPDCPLKPSAETLLHALVYRLYPEAATVLHTHSVNDVVVSKLYEQSGGLTLTDYELLKAFSGIQTHEASVWLPVFSNAQDMTALSAHVDAALQTHRATAPEKPVYGFLLAGHGLYTWGKNPAEAKRHSEAFEVLFDCHLTLRSYGYSDKS